MPPPAQAEALAALLDTQTPLVVVETHEEKRLIALAEAVARRSQRALWAWSASKGLRGLHGMKLALVDKGLEAHPDANGTEELPDALAAIDRLTGPALVLLLDILEKGLSGSQGDGDGTGAARRLLGTLLTWMAERRSQVLLVATANDIDSLPPELLRKGRFDEIFFIDLPAPARVRPCCRSTWAS